ncbi:glycosyltransferase [Pseudodesulfovibrio sp.]|uniref:glycosyltransferase n=1 Tax=Pseudodesulfovibrio sp. TaxID=2035812 RepID=UPI00263165FC|nr:glycosyltransferase [Pseudodesulfovibrio sp.]MDD3312202.1 glycosyltransferase [Pseudodesulfovibrio sp.]
MVILIPAYQPQNALVTLVDALRANGPHPVVVVNDGSAAGTAPVFAELKKRNGVTVLIHEKNMGKGQALKTGLNHILHGFPEAVGIVTADADGQHRPEDILAVADALVRSPGSLVLGTRDFGGGTPLRSRIGNLLTSKLFRFFLRCPLTDTQTGLRGLPREFARDILSLPSSGYDFEFEALARACRQSVPLIQVPIATVYLDGNRGSHFNPVLDSMKIYFVFFRFITSSLFVSLIDTLVFSAFFFASGTLLSSILAGRIVAGLSQFILSKKFVFNSDRSILWELLKYAMLVTALTTVAYQGISLLVAAGCNPYLAKILVDTLLFFTSFALQKILVFIH